MAKKKTTKKPKTVKHHKHAGEKRRNIPTAELDAVAEQLLSPAAVTYKREIAGRDADLDPQLIWRGKDLAGEFEVPAPPLFIQEKIHPKALVDDLRRQTEAARLAEAVREAGDVGVAGVQADLFADFNNLPKDADAKTEFYEHEQNWTNRMVLGDSLQIMTSLAEREGLRGKVQAIYFDPPYGIKFNSNFQFSTTSRVVQDGKADHITRQPEQVRAFRDTWRDGIHSYLTYLRDRLSAARELLHESGSLFVQIGDENVHRVRCLIDDVFGPKNCVSQITFTTTSSASSQLLPGVADSILWFAKDIEKIKYRPAFRIKNPGDEGATKYDSVEEASGLRRRMTNEEKLKPAEIDDDDRVFTVDQLTSQRPPGSDPFAFEGKTYVPPTGYWKTSVEGLNRLSKANRVVRSGNRVRYIRYLNDFSIFSLSNVWTDTAGVQSRTDPKVYVVQSATNIITRCLLMATDPGDLVLDPTCGSGTTAYVAEQWGRRWITIDTSRVALALARARLMGARYPYYLLSDSPEGRQKEAALSGTPVDDVSPTTGDLRHGFVYERVPHITLKSIANNADIDTIWERYEAKLKPIREEMAGHAAKLDSKPKHGFEEWEIPREAPGHWPKELANLHTEFWKLRIARQKEIDESIAQRADYEKLYDRPYEDKSKVRVAGPFTVESVSPHRVIGVDADGKPLDPLAGAREQRGSERAEFTNMVIESLKAAGVQQPEKSARLRFESLEPRAGVYVAAEGTYTDSGENEKRVGVLIGPEFGTLVRKDLLTAAIEAKEAGLDLLVAAAFAFDPHAGEVDTAVPVLLARMNADLHMAADLADTDKGNAFVVFGEPDVDVLGPEGTEEPDVESPDVVDVSEYDMIRVRVKGIDIYNPATGEVQSKDADGIACWFVDTDYDGQSFFVRHAYFVGQDDPYKQLKRTLKAEIDEEAWETVVGTVSREFPKPMGGKIAVKIINHLGDEVMRVLSVK